MQYLKGVYGSWIWLLVRLYVGWQWIDAGWHKITGATPFDATGYLKGAAAKIIPAATLTPEQLAKFKPITATWWGDFLNGFAIPNAKLFNVLIPYGELLVGIGLIVGFATIFTATMAITMNFAFLMSGSTSSNPYLLVLAFILITLGGAHAGYLGVDYWVRPFLRSKLGLVTEGAAAKSAA